MHFEIDFSNLKIQKPLFYNWPIGLRFEIGPPEIGTGIGLNDLYFKEAHKRSVAIFEACFANGDEIIVVYQQYSDGRKKIRKSNYVLKQIEKNGKFEQYDVRDIYELEYKCKCWKRVIVQGLKRDDINYSNILLALVNTDFARRPSTNGECYFINSTTGLILNLYDDRGMDVISKTSEVLKPIYERFNDWLLDYDRKDMDSVFA
jgi:hypothetical protein